MKNTMILLAVVLAVILVGCTQHKESGNGTFFKAERAYFEDEDNVKAFDLLKEVLEDEPFHVDALFLRSRIYYEADKFDNAIRDVNLAIRNYKGEPQVYRSTLYHFAATYCSNGGDIESAISNEKKAVKWAKRDRKERVQDYKFCLAQYYYENDDSEGADKVYDSMLRDDATDVAAMVGLVRNMNNRGEYQAVLELMDKAAGYDGSYAEIYRMRMHAYFELEEYDKAIDDAVSYIRNKRDEKDDFDVHPYLRKHYTYAVARIKKEIKTAGDNRPLQNLLARTYIKNHDFQAAAEYLTTLEKERGEDIAVLYARSQIYSEIGLFSKAMKDINRVMEIMGSGETMKARAVIYRNDGQYAKAIADYKAALENNPTDGHTYYSIGRCYELSGDKESALRYYNEGIDVDKELPHLFSCRADLLLERGDTLQALVDYGKVLEIDTVPEANSFRQYALFGLGRVEDAVIWMEKIIRGDPTDFTSYYDKARLCSRMGDIDEALDALEKALKCGFRRFALMRDEPDLAAIRNLPRFKALIQEYKDKPVSTWVDESVDTENPSRQLVSEIQMKRMPGGTYEVPCSINGLPLKFIFDTGASDVTISSVEANFMLKNDYLAIKDFKGSRKYLTADGNISEGALICIREVKVGDAVLKNIDASVVKNQKAPLLLGQSAIERFGSVTIDNTESKLIIKHY